MQKRPCFDVDPEPRIVEVAPGVHTAVGISLANVSMVEGEDGIILVDTGMGHEECMRVAAGFRAITDKPVAAVLYTHSHPDHVSGTACFLESNAENAPIWARANFGAEERSLQGLLTHGTLRATRKFGFNLPAGKRRSSAVIFSRCQHFSSVHAPLSPTHTFSGREHEITVAGVRLLMRAVPGETEDHMCVWVSERSVLFAGDTVYRCFPNISPLRGVPYRDVARWADALDALLKFPAEVLVPGHTAPISGKKRIREVIRDVRDALRHVHQRTVEAMNLGLGPDELGDFVKLPPRLAEKEHLSEIYGSVEWAARAIYAGLWGWFDGNPARLASLNPQEEAERLARLAGGRKHLLRAAKAALEERDWRWALRLADALLRFDPHAAEPKRVKMEALSALANAMTPICSYNYLMSCSEELREQLAKRASS